MACVACRPRPVLRVILPRRSFRRVGSVVRWWQRRGAGRIAAALIGATMPLACAVPEPPSVSNRFLGTWATAENDSVTIRQDTIVQTQPDGHTTALDKETCRGVFRFVYNMESRQRLTDLVPRQPELRKKLSEMLV